MFDPRPLAFADLHLADAHGLGIDYSEHFDIYAEHGGRLALGLDELAFRSQKKNKIGIGLIKKKSV